MKPITQEAEIVELVRNHVNLADERLGAEAVACSDDFFAPMQRMLNPQPAQFIPGKYDDNGKWMDGWETGTARKAAATTFLYRRPQPDSGSTGASR